ncbi:pyrroline-5-carboxylate reductase [Rhodococcus aerolatus]
MVGAGRIGEALLGGLVAAGRDPATLLLCERDADRAAQVSREHGVEAVDAAAAAARADVVVLAVKPGSVPETLAGLGDLPATALVVSLCAGVSTAALESALAPGTPVVRVMPNTPMLVREGMAAASAGAHAGPEHLEEVRAMMSAVGRVVVVPESHQDAVTALSGSGPAYLLLLAEAMVDAGVLLGLPRDVATELVAQTAVGSAHLLRDTGTHPALLREAVTSPAGTTAAALRTLDDRGVHAAVVAAVEAARDRSVALGG